MSSIHTNSKGRELLIYPNNNKLILRYKNNHIFSQPIIITRDYDCELSDVIFNDTLYYSYVNPSGSIIVKKAGDQDFKYELPAKDNIKFSNLKLTYIDNHLMLFFSQYSSNTNTYCVNCVFPLGKNISFVLPENSYSSSLVMDICSVENYIIVGIFSKGIIEVFCISKDLKIMLLDDKENIERLNNYLIKKENELLSIKENFSNVNDELSTVKKELSENETKIKQLEGVIDSVSKQYNELMEVATKYKEEAIRWNKLYIKRKGNS